ncbi:MAG TPA: hypothetical protein VK464_14320 [Symbiobacteriaceae bacterium]|nr:hypothetical protein [Symbiobacteriaceae bacterium]
MAANNPKTQLVKMGIGTVSVVAIVGVTGWVWQADQAAAAGAGTAAHAMEQSAPAARSQGRSRGGTFASPSTSGTTQQQPRTRTKHS